MKTYEELVTWIKNHVNDVEDPEGAALWFISCQEAEYMFSGSIKDNAYWVLSGIQPMTPEIVTNWLVDQRAMADDDYEAMKAIETNPTHYFLPELIEALKHHFGSNLK